MQCEKICNFPVFLGETGILWDFRKITIPLFILLGRSAKSNRIVERLMDKRFSLTEATGIVSGNRID